ncbi:phage/plasmid primase, P4 family [Photobacterium leiognathi]|uniref:phage/plasmid primase, P4 family n=1 Tax=Photobacterium leiognathi TaxID=553611 RepID=UPI00273980B0|nr:phage/plasmid primase, P4 family [Photobacterium leiognathi]
MLIIDQTSTFVSAIINTGIKPPKEIITDGQIHRFSSNGKTNNKSGYYAFFAHTNGFNAGFFGCWQTNLYSTWSSKHTSVLTDFERTQLEECRAKAERLRQKVHEDRTKYANKLWTDSEPAPSSHPYLVKKQITECEGIGYMRSIPCCDFFMDKTRTTHLRNVLIIPIYDQNNNVQSIQAINADGKKFFMKGGKMSGGLFPLVGSTETIYVCEGYATGVSLYQLTKATIIVTFNANNLEKVAPTLSAIYPDSAIIVAADNDHRKEKEGKGNKGLEVAGKLLELHRLPYTYPLFDENDSGTDWNDYICNNSADIAEQALIDNLQNPPVIYESYDECLAALKENNRDEHAFNCAIKMLANTHHLMRTTMRNQLKDASGADIGDIRRAIGDYFHSIEEQELTHSEIADEYLSKITPTPLVGVFGKLWKYNEVTGVWQEQSLEKTGVTVARQFVVEGTCRKNGDYKAIASHIYDTASNEEFFDNAPAGLHTPTGFIYADGKQLKKCSSSPDHRARFCLDIEPDFNNEPTKVLMVLNEAFYGHYAEEQIRQLQMLTRMTLLGLLPKEQRVVFLYGAAGSGKSLYLRLIEAIIPCRFRTSISPLDLDSDYKVAALASKLINLVPEIDKEKPVPSAQFKAITGGDTVSAREPYGKVFTFTPNTACWFNGNYYPTTKDYTEGFWRRWTIIHFANTKPAKERNPKLVDEIIKEELPAFIGWALKGAADYLNNGLYLSPVHGECLAEWKRDGNSVTCWLNANDDNAIAPREKGAGKQPLKVTHAYTIYREWCRSNNRQAFNSTTFKVHMTNAGYSTTVYNGYNCFDALYDTRSTLSIAASWAK